MHFKEFQQGVFIYISLLLVAVLLVGIYFVPQEHVEGRENLWMVFALVCLIVMTLFYGLKTEVNDDHIILKFGIGIIKKRIALNNIERVSVVRNKWYYGLGIRFYGKGWLWNIRGLDAVELKFKESNWKFRIGTSRPNDLEKSIKEKMS